MSSHHDGFTEASVRLADLERPGWFGDFLAGRMTPDTPAQRAFRIRQLRQAVRLMRGGSTVELPWTAAQLADFADLLEAQPIGGER